MSLGSESPGVFGGKDSVLEWLDADSAMECTEAPHCWAERCAAAVVTTVTSAAQVASAKVPLPPRRKWSETCSELARVGSEERRAALEVVYSAAARQIEEGVAELLGHTPEEVALLAADAPDVPVYQPTNRAGDAEHHVLLAEVIEMMGDGGDQTLQSDQGALVGKLRRAVESVLTTERGTEDILANARSLFRVQNCQTMGAIRLLGSAVVGGYQVATHLATGAGVDDATIEAMAAAVARSSEAAARRRERLLHQDSAVHTCSGQVLSELLLALRHLSRRHARVSLHVALLEREMEFHGLAPLVRHNELPEVRLALEAVGAIRELAETGTTLAETDRSLQEATRSLGQMADSVRELSRDKEKLRTVNGQLVDRLAQQTHEVQRRREVERERAALRSENQRLQGRLAKQTRRLEELPELRRRVQRAEQDTRDTQAMLTAEEERRADLEEHVVVLEQEARSRDKQLRRALDDLERTRQERDSAEHTAAEAEAAAEAAAREVRVVECSRCRAAEERHLALRRQLAALAEEAAEETEAARSHAAAVVDVVRGVVGELGSFDAELRAPGTEAEIVSATHLARAELDDLRLRAEALRNEVLSSHQNHPPLLAEVNSMECRRDALVKEVDLLRGQAEELSTLVRHTGYEVADLNEQKLLLQPLVASLRTEVARMRMLLDTTTAAHAHAVAQLEGAVAPLSALLRSQPREHEKETST